MADLPTNVSTGMVFGRFIISIVDGYDEGQEPDAIPATGSITFDASVPYLPNPSAGPSPVTILKVPIKGILDEEGYLCTPHPVTGVAMYRGVRLVATDDPDLLVSDWTWTATYRFDSVNASALQIPAHSFALPGGTEVDLTTAVKVPASPGYGLPQAEAAVLRAESAALSAESAALSADEDAAEALASALRAEQVAGATDAGVALLLDDPGTDTGGILSDKLAEKVSTSDMNNALSAKADTTELTTRLAGKADLVAGKVPVAQLPTDEMNKNLIEDPASLTAGALSAAIDDTFISEPNQESSTVGANIATGTGWALGAGWAGDFATGFTHTPGSTEPLTWAPGVATGTTTYLVEWKWEGTTTDQFAYAGYDVTLGGGGAGIIYQGGAPSNVNYSRAIKSVADGSLVFTPWATFEGRIHSVTVRPLVAPAAIPYNGWRSSLGRVAELRGGRFNMYLGVDAGKWDYSGSRNAGYGHEALANNVSGFFNAAFGYNALKSLVNGTRNVGVGYNALVANVSGDRNVGVGPFAMSKLVDGQRNVAVGVDILYNTTSGDDNVGMGYLALTELRTGDRNIAVGRYAMRNSRDTSDVVAIGTQAGEYAETAAAGMVAIGREALRDASAGAGLVAVGQYALAGNRQTNSFNTGVGSEAGRWNRGSFNTILGYNAMKGTETSGSLATAARNTVIGSRAGEALVSGNFNLLIGENVAVTLATGSKNILIGNNVNGRSGDFTGGSDFLNIGNVLHGDLATGCLSIGDRTQSARLTLPAGQATAGMAPLKFKAGPLLTSPEPGVIEFDGTNYYATIGGVRKPLAFAA